MAMKMATLEIPANEAGRYEAAIKDLFGRMDRLRRQMKRDQADIEKSRKRTRTKLAEIKRILR
jgi:molecular chaperone GrpE (heat shock protein)